jgi:leader peptidase (prepilin peptidase)/N-methyltransferase
VTSPETTKPIATRSIAQIARLVRGHRAQALGKCFFFGLIAVVAAIVSVEGAPGLSGALGGCLAVLMLTIAIIDWRSFIIPDSLNIVGFCLGLLHTVVKGQDDMPVAIMVSITRGAVLAGIFLAIRYGYAHVRKRQGIGLGDIKLAAVAGAWLEWSIMPIAVEIAAFSALSFYAFRHFVLGRPISATTRLPFGLFFAPTIWICWLLETTVLAQR